MAQRGATTPHIWGVDDEMYGEPMDPGLALILTAKGACCVAYFGVGAGLFSAADLIAWLGGGDGLLTAAGLFLLAGTLWVARLRRPGDIRIPYFGRRDR